MHNLQQAIMTALIVLRTPDQPITDELRTRAIATLMQLSNLIDHGDAVSRL